MHIFILTIFYIKYRTVYYSIFALVVITSKRPRPSYSILSWNIFANTLHSNT